MAPGYSKLEDTRNQGDHGGQSDAEKKHVDGAHLLYTGVVTYKIGSVDEGTATMDWMEQRRAKRGDYHYERGDVRFGDRLQ